MDDEYRRRELGEFLRKRRRRISPTQVGLPYGRHRRTLGLKREEVAELANVSLTWYTWLEQSRTIKVSSQVLKSIGHALLLNETEMRYIFRLSQLAMTDTMPQESRIVSNSLKAIINKLEPFPSFVFDQYWNIIGGNTSAKIIFGDFCKMNDRERNTIWRMFTDPGQKRLFLEWDKVAQWMVARFRLSTAAYVSDQWLKKFVQELMMESGDFRKCWSKHNVFYEDDFKKRLMIEPIGELVCDFTCLDVCGNPQIKIAAYTPANEVTSEKLKIL